MESRSSNLECPREKQPRRTQRSLKFLFSSFFAVSAASAVAFPFAVAVPIAFVVTATAQAPDRARTEALARRATERLQALQHEADRLAAEERTVIGDVRKLEIERQIRAE